MFFLWTNNLFFFLMPWNHLEITELCLYTVCLNTLAICKDSFDFEGERRSLPNFEKNLLHGSRIYRTSFQKTIIYTQQVGIHLTWWTANQIIQVTTLRISGFLMRNIHKLIFKIESVSVGHNKVTKSLKAIIQKAIIHRNRKKIKVHRFTNNLQGLQKWIVKDFSWNIIPWNTLLFEKTLKQLSILDNENYGL